MDPVSPKPDAPDMFARSAILKNFGWMSFDKVVRLGLGLFLGVWIARYLGPDQFGVLNFAIAFVGLFAALPVLGLPSLLVKEYIASPDDVRLTMGTSFVMQLAAGILTAILAIAVISLSRPDDSEVHLLVVILSSLLPLRAMASLEAYYESTMQAKVTVRCQLIGFVVFAGVKVLLLISKAPLMAFAVVITAEASLFSVCLLGTFLRDVLPVRQWRFSFAKAKALLRSSVFLMLSGVAVTIYLRVDQVMLGEMVDASAVGVYSAAVRLSEIWYLIPTMVVASVAPNLFKSRNRSESEFIGKFQGLFNALCVFSILVAGAMSLFASPIIAILFGEDFVDAGPILAVHIWALPFVAFGVASSSWFVAQNRQDLAFRRTLLGLVTNVILNLILIPPFAGLGAAIATLISYAVSGLIADAFSKVTRSMFLMKVKSFNFPRILLKVVCHRNGLSG